MAVLAAFLRVKDGATYKNQPISRVDVDTLGNAHLIGESASLFIMPEAITVLMKGRMSDQDQQWIIDNALPGQRFILERVIGHL